MMDGVILLQFIAVSLVVLLIPGPGVLYVVARSLSQGQRAGLISVLGLSVGALIHVAAATIGLSAILLSSATLFGFIKYLGAAYLIYLGINALMSNQSATDIALLDKQTFVRIFIDGFIVSVLNPKIAIFFMAYLPQFVVSTTVEISSQILVLGLIYVALAILTDGCYALFAGFVRGRLVGHMMSSYWPSCFSGWLYIGLGVNTALTGYRKI